MKRLLSIFLFLIPVVACVVLFYIRYEEGTEHERLLKQAEIKGTELQEKVIHLEHTLVVRAEELSHRESQLLLSRKRTALLEEYIEARADIPEIKTAYITIDDGPSLLTTEILDVLIEQNVPATFFVVGSDDPEFDHYYKRILDDGHPLGNHSFGHDYSILYSGIDEFLKDIEKQDEYLALFSDVPVRLFRFPGGSNNPQPLIHGGGSTMMNRLKLELAEKGYIYHDWNVFPNDVGEELKSVEELIIKMKEQISHRKNVNILLHDHSGNVTTPEALTVIIEHLRTEGYCILPLSENTNPIRF